MKFSLRATRTHEASLSRLLVSFEMLRSLEFRSLAHLRRWDTAATACSAACPRGTRPGRGSCPVCGDRGSWGCDLFVRAVACHRLDMSPRQDRCSRSAFSPRTTRQPTARPRRTRPRSPASTCWPRDDDDGGGSDDGAGGCGRSARSPRPSPDGPLRK